MADRLLILIIFASWALMLVGAYVIDWIINGGRRE